jgi:hypothetical protein
MDIHKYMETYRYGVDVTKEGRVKFEYLDYERNFINHINDNRFSITKKARQMHMTTLLAHYVTWFLLFNENREKSTIMFIAASSSNGKDFTRLVRENLNDFHSSIQPQRSTTREIMMVNGNLLKTATPTADACRGYTIDKLLIDGAAYIDNLEDVLAVAFPALSTGGSATIVSTPNRYNDFFKIWENNKMMRNDFKRLSIIWSDNPKRNQEWFDQMCKNMNYDQDMIDQELLAKFIPWRPKENKTVNLQVRIQESTLNEIYKKMSEKNISSHSDYLRNLILKDVNK